jgi:lipoate-protein ligase A
LLPIWRARKGVGSAQRRKNGRVLHHGSIKLGSSPLEGDIATIQDVAGPVDPATLAGHLKHAFQAQLGLQFETGVPTAEERQQAHELGTRYLSEEFLKRR